MEEEAVVLRLVLGTLETPRSIRTAPLVCCPPEQRVVEIERAPYTILSPLASTLGGVEQAERFLVSSGSVIGRLRCSEYLVEGVSAAICVPMSLAKCVER